MHHNVICVLFVQNNKLRSVWTPIVGRHHIFAFLFLGGSTRTKNFLLEKLQRDCVLLSFVVVVDAVLQGKFPAHPGGEGIMTGLWSGEEEARAQAQQSLSLMAFQTP